MMRTGQENIVAVDHLLTLAPARRDLTNTAGPADRDRDPMREVGIANTGNQIMRIQAIAKRGGPRMEETKKGNLKLILLKNKKKLC
jgi:hypothetical protein